MQFALQLPNLDLRYRHPVAASADSQESCRTVLDNEMEGAGDPIDRKVQNIPLKQLGVRLSLRPNGGGQK